MGNALREKKIAVAPLGYPDHEKKVIGRPGWLDAVVNFIFGNRNDFLGGKLMFRKAVVIQCVENARRKLKLV